jgi:signal transduction histidine kinase
MTASAEAAAAGAPPAAREPAAGSILQGSLGFLIIGVVLVAGMIAGAFALAQRSSFVFDTVVEERGVRRAASDLLSAVQVAESSKRGYVLTGEPEMLAAYNAARTQIPAYYGEVRQRVIARDGDAAAIAGLESTIAERLDALAAVLAAAEAGEVDAPDIAAVNYAGTQAMDDTRAILNEVMATSDSRISSAIADQRRTTQRLTLAIAAATIVMAALVAGAMAIIARRARELARAQDELRVLNESLEERVNLRTEDLMRANQEVQRFAYIVTHDLRAPLVNIMGFTSELEEATKPIQAYVLAEGEEVTEQVVREARAAASEDLPEAIGFIRASARKMDSLINAILTISRSGRRQVRPQRVDLEELVQRAAEAVGHQILANDGKIETVVEAPSIVSDRMAIDQILGNLLDNAVKYAHPDRPLELKVRVLPAGGAYVRIEVEDNGRGIAPEDRERIFELFRRAGRQDRAGEGVGLAHVRSLARSLGGEITVQSVLSEGSTFILRLPTDLRKFLETAGMGAQWDSR